MSTQNIENPETFKDWKALFDIYVSSKGNGRLKKEQIAKISELYGDILLLKKHGITSKNYNSKARDYYNFRKKALEEYGIWLSTDYPFKSPTQLFYDIHMILLEAKLNDKQIDEFYKLSKIRNARPKKIHIDTAVRFKNAFPGRPEIMTNPINIEEEMEIDNQNDRMLELKNKFQRIQHKCLLT